MTIGKDLNYYLSLPYTIELVREDESTWFARVAELPGCMTEADSPAEAAAMISDALACWIEVALADGQPIPEPRAVEDYSGKFVVRVSRCLHRDLVAAAERDDVSLNQYVATELARAVGRDQAWHDLDSSSQKGSAEAGRIVLTPARISHIDAVREKLADLAITEADVDAAVQWSRRQEERNG